MGHDKYTQKVAGDGAACIIARKRVSTGEWRGGAYNHSIPNTHQEQVPG